MSNLRIDTFRTGAYLVRKLQAAGARVLHDGGDILLVEDAGQKISIHLIESALPLYELKTILETNQKDGIHTLCMFWCDALVPDDGAWYEPDESMAAILALHGKKLYAYEYYGSEVFLFPVYFEPHGAQFRVRHGATIERTFLECREVHTAAPGFSGSWRVADFAGQPSEAWWQQRREQEKSRAEKAASPDRVTLYYAVLGVTKDDNAAAVKRAYRMLARRYHPDLNDSPDATARMQAINEAYTWILSQLRTGE
jgi:hypothetical protein